MGKNSQPDAKPRFRSHQTAAAIVKHRAVSVPRRWYNNQRGFLSAFEPLCPHSGRFVTVHHRRRRLATVRFYSFVRTIRPSVFTPLRRSDGTLARGSLFSDWNPRGANHVGKCVIFSTALEVGSLTAMLGNHIKKPSLRNIGYR